MGKIDLDVTKLSAGARTVASGLRRPSLPPGLIGAIACLLDFVATGLGLWAGRLISVGTDFDPVGAALLSAAAAPIVVTALWLAGAYRLAVLRRFWRGIPLLLGCGLAAALAVGVTPAAALALLAFLPPARALGAAMAAAALDFGVTERRAVIIGGGERAKRVLSDLAQSPGNDIRVWGIFDDRDDVRSPPVVAGIPKLGTLDSLVAFARTAEIDMLIITLPLTAEKRIREILRSIEVLPLDVRLSDFSTDAGFRRRSSWDCQSGLVELVSRPLRSGQRAAKRALDIVGAAAAIVLFMPVMLVTALAIRLETPGPILFRQPRHGYNHRPVEIWKFRSMIAAECDPAALRIVTRGDPRVTRVGRVIRRWSIDELPQLFNVLAGDLSLVGPRPHALAAMSSRQEPFEALVDGYAARHKVKPGLTGWAQIHGWRGEIDDPAALRRRVEHDLHYIENWSIWLDLYVLAATPLRLLDGRRAY
jgi:Undecaprenyl-phosphate glucose phosphotransferase